VEEQRRQKAAELNKAVKLEKEIVEKRQLKNEKGSLLQQLREEEKAYLNKNMSNPRQSEQKHEQALFEFSQQTRHDDE